MNLLNLMKFLRGSKSGVRSSKKGFTLVELLIVIVILGIIAALVLPRLVSQPEKARVAQAGNSLGILGRTLQARFQMSNQWLAITSANFPSLGLATSPDTPEWTFSTTSGTAPAVVTATRVSTSTPPPPAGCNAGTETVTLDTTTGTFNGTGCYAATGAYPANTILKGA